MAIGRNILIYHLGALGDFIITWPFALTLARIYPQSRVFYVTNSEKGALAERVLRVESLDVESGWHHLFSEEPALPEPLHKRLAGAHSVVSFIAGPDEVWTRNVHAISPQATVVNLTTQLPASFRGHVTEYLAGQLDPWTAGHTAVGQILKSIALRGLTLDRTPGEAIVVHPGSGAPRKNWPLAHFAELIESLHAEGRPVRVLLGEAEADNSLAAFVSRVSKVAEVATPATLVGLFQELRSARLFIGNDSGPGHLAGIMGVPTISLFGPTSSAVQWRPLGPAVRVIETPALESLGVSVVHKEVSRLLAK